MVKLIGAVMTGFACGYFGFRLRMALKTRLRSLADICASLETLEGEICFSVNRLKKAFIRADTNGLFASAAEDIEEMGAQKAWNGAVRKMKNKLCLTDADTEILLMLGKNIGKTDSDDQIKSIRYIKTLLAAQEKQAGEEYQSRAKLYSSGGVLVGALVVIILI